MVCHETILYALFINKRNVDECDATMYHGHSKAGVPKNSLVEIPAQQSIFYNLFHFFIMKQNNRSAKEHKNVDYKNLNVTILSVICNDKF